MRDTFNLAPPTSSLKMSLVWNASIHFALFVVRLVSAQPLAPMSDGHATEFPSPFGRLSAMLLEFLVDPGRREYYFAERLSISGSIRTADDSYGRRSLPSPHEESSAPKITVLSLTRLTTEGTDGLISLNKEWAALTLRANPAFVPLALSFNAVSFADREKGCGCGDTASTFTVSKPLSKDFDLCRAHSLVSRLL